MYNKGIAVIDLRKYWGKGKIALKVN